MNSADALRIGLADQVLPGPRPSFEDMVLAHARRLAGHDDYYRLLEGKRVARAAEERRRPLDVYRTEELAAMSRDIFDDRLGFAAARHAFVMKRPADTQRTDTRTGAQRIVALPPRHGCRVWTNTRRLPRVPPTSPDRAGGCHQ